MAEPQNRAARLYPEDFGRSNLMGLTSWQPNNHFKNDIAINPNLTEDIGINSLIPTLGHEFTHAAGWNNEAIPEYIAELVRKREIEREFAARDPKKRKK